MLKGISRELIINVSKGLFKNPNTLRVKATVAALITVLYVYAEFLHVYSSVILRKQQMDIYSISILQNSIKLLIFHVLSHGLLHLQYVFPLLVFKSGLALS